MLRSRCQATLIGSLIAFCWVAVNATAIAFGQERGPDKVLEGHAGLIKSIEFNPSGSLLASGSDDRTVRIWTIPGGELIATLEMPDGVRKVQWYRDDALVAHTRPVKLDGSDRLVICTGIGKSPNPAQACLADEGVRVRDFTVLPPRGVVVAVLTAATKLGASAKNTPDGAKVVVCDMSGGRVLRELVSGHLDAVRDFADEQWRVRPNNDGTQLFVSGQFFGPKKQSAIAVYDANTWEQLRVLKGSGYNRDLVVSPDGQLIASAVIADDPRKSGGGVNAVCGVRIWDVNKGNMVSESMSGTGWIRSLSFSFDSKQLCAAYYYGRGHSTGRNRGYLHSGILLWSADRNSWSVIAPETFGPNYGAAPGRGWISFAAFSPRNNELATALASPPRLAIRNLSSQGSVIDSGLGTSGSVVVVYSPDGQVVAALPQAYGALIPGSFHAEKDLKTKPIIAIWRLNSQAPLQQSPPSRAERRDE